MTDNEQLTRKQAETCVEQIKLMYPGFTKRPDIYGQPILLDTWDADGRWTVHREDSPYSFASVVPQGRLPGVPAAPDWPEGVAVSPVNDQVLALYPV